MIKLAVSAVFLASLGLEYLNITKTEKVDKTLRFNEDGEFTIL